MEFQPMSPEEVERTMQFLLQSQAQFEANFARFSKKTEADFSRLSEGLLGLTALHNQTERKVRDLVDSMGAVREGLVALTGIVGRMSDRIEKVGQSVDQRLDAVGEIQRRQAESGERLDQRLDRLEKSQERTDQQIKAFQKSQERTDKQIRELGAHFKRHLREDHGRRPS